MNPRSAAASARVAASGRWHAALGRRLLGEASQCWSEWYDETFDYTFGRREGTPQRGPNPRLLPEISTDNDDAYDLLNSIYEYLMGRFGRNGANARGGTGNNADSYHPYERVVVFTYRDFTTNGRNCPYGAMYWFDSTNIELCKGMAVPDILSHEYFHSLTDWTCDLAYEGESGGLNEANSFILAECFEHAHMGSADWISGSGLPSDAPYYDLANPKDSSLHAGVPRLADRLNSAALICD